MGDAVRVTDDADVRTMTLCRAGEYNTITPQLRDELADAIDSAQHDDRFVRSCSTPRALRFMPDTTLAGRLVNRQMMSRPKTPGVTRI